jgi:hypothetical protein
LAETTVKNFYAASFDALVKRWDKCINVGGGYVEKKKRFTLQVRISHILRFISICDLFTDSPSYIRLYIHILLILESILQYRDLSKRRT